MSYAQQSDAESLFGVQNIARWSQLDNTVATANTARIATALAMADAYINDRLYSSQYLVPLVLRGNGGGNMNTIVDLAARLTGVWLYESRGMADTQGEDGEFDNTRDKIARHRKYVDNVLAKIRCGKIWISCQYNRQYTTQPQCFG